MEREADVAIVGLGAAGGIAAHVLTRAGLDVVALEAGPRLAASQMTLDEIRNDARNWMSEPKSRGEVPTWRLDGSQVTEMLMVNGVGGTSVHYHAWSLRLPPWQFEARTRTLERYGPAAIPNDSTLADWPISHADLEPFYDEAERAIGVSGQAGNLGGKLQPGGNPFEGPRAREFPMPPVRPSGFTDMMADAARALGWHPFPAAAAVNSVPYGGRPACTYCGFCASNGCYNDAKGATHVNVIPWAEATGRLRVETNARVTRIDVDKDGLASGVTYIKDGREQSQKARVVLLSALVYENTRLLLMSRSNGFADGLSNNHGQVGKHYMAHISVRRYGTFPDRRLNRLNGALRRPGHVRRRLERRQLRSLTRGLHRWWHAQRDTRRAADSDDLASAAARHAALGLSLEGLDAEGRRVHRARRRRAVESAVRVELHGPRSGRAGPVWRAGRPCQPPHWRQRASRIGFPERQAAPLARGGRRGEHVGHRPHATGESTPIRRNTHGPRSSDIGRRPIRFLARSAEPRRPGRLELSDHWWSQPDAHRAGIELAHGTTPRG